MGDLEVDTRVEPRGDGFTAQLSRDWEIWGPNGGYLAAIALRAAGAVSRFRRPASFSVHYLGVATFGEVTLDVQQLKGAKRAESLRVTMSQGGAPILAAMVWAVDSLAGLQHDETRKPDVPGPSELKSYAELNPEADGPPIRFWGNFDGKPVAGREIWPPASALPAVVQNWYRYTPRATFDDPYVDAARSLLLIDTMQWPAAARPHAHRQMGYVAPTIDLAVNFHQLAPEREWLLCVAEAPIARDGLIGGKASIWTEDGRLLASGAGHLLCRPSQGAFGAA